MGISWEYDWISWDMMDVVGIYWVYHLSSLIYPGPFGGWNAGDGVLLSRPCSPSIVAPVPGRVVMHPQ